MKSFERTENKILVIAGIIVAVACLLAPVVWSGIIQGRVVMNFGEVKDSIILQKRGNGTVINSFKYTSVSTVDSAVTVGTDSIVQYLLKAYKDASTTSVCFTFNTRTTPGPIDFSVPVYYPESNDSIRWTVYIDGAASSTGLNTATASFDSNFTGYRDQHIQVRLDNWYIGETYPLTTVLAITWDSLGSSPFATPPARTCIVDGYIKELAGIAMRDVQVTFTMPEPAVNTCDSTLLVTRSSVCYTNANGYFIDTLAWSSCYGNKDYQVEIGLPGASPIKRTITVPDSAHYRLRW